MKKVWTLLLSVLVLLTLCACGPDESDDSNLTEKPVTMAINEVAEGKLDASHMDLTIEEN